MVTLHEGEVSPSPTSMNLFFLPPIFALHQYLLSDFFTNYVNHMFVRWLTVTMPLKRDYSSRVDINHL